MATLARDTRVVPAVPVLLAALAAATYANAMANGFVLDDRGIILQHPLVQAPGDAWRAFGQPYWPANVGGGQYRPLGIMSFALDQAIAGNAAAWYHAVNVAWHALVVVLVYQLGLAVLAPVGAVVAAVLFAVHPVHVEAVANVVGRLELMAAAFGLATVLLHRKRHPAAVLAFAAALCSKEGALVLPVLAVLGDAIPGRRAMGRGSARGLLLGYLGVTAVWALLLRQALGDGPLSVTSAVFADQGIGDRWLTVLTVVPHYVRLLLAPARLSSDYEPDVIVPVHDVTPAVLLGLAVVLAWGGCVAMAWRRQPVVAFALAWIPVALAPVSNVVFASGVALAERTLYLPSVGVALLAGWASERVPAGRRQVGLAVGLVVMLLAVGRTWTRTPVWRDARAHALALLEEHPQSYRGHWVAARVLAAADNIDGAAREFELARRIYGRDVSLLRESASLEARRGREAVARALADSAAAIAARRNSRGGGS